MLGGAWGGERAYEVWKMDTLEIGCCIRGYHFYQDVWEAAIDEELVCRPERCNGHDWYPMAVMKNDRSSGWPSSQQVFTFVHAIHQKRWRPSMPRGRQKTLLP